MNNNKVVSCFYDSYIFVTINRRCVPKKGKDPANHSLLKMNFISECISTSIEERDKALEATREAKEAAKEAAEKIVREAKEAAEKIVRDCRDSQGGKGGCREDSQQRRLPRR